jgi:hypothetical protein
MHPTDCRCEWRGRYRKQEVVLSKWARCKIDPRTKGEAIVVLNRFVAALDAGTFDPAGERPIQGSAQTLSGFIAEWKTHWADERGLSANSLEPMLNVLATGRLGAFSLEQLAGESEEIERWLNATSKARRWTAKPWNEYHGLLNRILKRATLWKSNGKPRLAANPMAAIERKVQIEPDHFKARHLVEDVEDRLFTVVDELNRPQHRPNRNKLTQDKADAIRRELAEGQGGIVLAAKYGVSAAVVSAVKHGDIWNPERIASGTKGDEMRRRLIAAFDGGLRAGEMLRIQLHHVDWKPMIVTQADGTRTQAYEITLPPTLTKGGKTTGQTERSMRRPSDSAMCWSRAALP